VTFLLFCIVFEVLKLVQKIYWRNRKIQNPAEVYKTKGRDTRIFAVIQPDKHSILRLQPRGTVFGCFLNFEILFTNKIKGL